MAGDIWNIFLNLIAALIFSGLTWLWQRRGSRLMPSVIVDLPPQVEEPEPDRRTHNRQAAEQFFYKFFFYLSTFGVLYLSITMPPLFKALFSKTDVLLSDARFIGDLLPAVPIGKSYLQVAFFSIAAALYVPMLMFAEFITSLLHPLIDSFRPVTGRIWSATTMLVFFLFCIPVSAASIWLFYPKTFQDCLISVFVFLFVVFAFGQAQGGRR